MLDAFFQSLANLSRRVLTPSSFNSAQWKAVAPAIRQVSFFSATVNKMRVLSAYKRMLTDWIEGATEEVNGPYGQATAYKVGSQADFVMQSRELLIKEGLASPEDFKDERLSNIGSSERLKLVFNTNIQQAQQLTTWQRKVSNPDYINQFPAARFIRTPGVTSPRPRHIAAENEVRRWDDFEFWLFQNAADIGGFEVPWGPWGFNSYMLQEPVKRKEAERLGLVKPGEIVKPIDGSRWGAPADKLKDGTKANIKAIPLEISAQGQAELKAQFGSDFINDNGKISLKAFNELRRKAGV
jgi:hypothetical protein